MSQQPQIPRLLATLLGVEPPPPSGPPRSTAPPAGAPSSARGGGVPVATRAREVRETPQAPRQRAARTVPDEGPDDGASDAPVPRRSPSRDGSPRTAPTATRASVRRTLASSEALRAGVVVAEILGDPRALRPYGVDRTA